MSDPLLRELDHYVVLEPGAGERILTAGETRLWLEQQLGAMGELPDDLRGLGTRAEQAERLLQTACQLELEPGRSVQWFAVRLEPPGTA
jgi:hypothetical protein